MGKLKFRPKGQKAKKHKAVKSGLHRSSPIEDFVRVADQMFEFMYAASSEFNVTGSRIGAVEMALGMMNYYRNLDAHVNLRIFDDIRTGKISMDNQLSLVGDQAATIGEDQYDAETNNLPTLLKWKRIYSAEYAVAYALAQIGVWAQQKEMAEKLAAMQAEGEVVNPEHVHDENCDHGDEDEDEGDDQETDSDEQAPAES